MTNNNLSLTNSTIVIIFLTIVLFTLLIVVIIVYSKKLKNLNQTVLISGKLAKQMRRKYRRIISLASLFLLFFSTTIIGFAAMYYTNQTQ